MFKRKPKTLKEMYNVEEINFWLQENDNSKYISKSEQTRICSIAEDTVEKIVPLYNIPIKPFHSFSILITTEKGEYMVDVVFKGVVIHLSQERDCITRMTLEYDLFVDDIISLEE